MSNDNCQADVEPNPEPVEEKDKQPIFSLEYAGRSITVLGTAHVSRASAEKVKELLSTGEYATVAVELCPNRYTSIVNPESMANMDLFKVIKEGKTFMVMASLALGAYQQRIAEEFGIEPGAEMRMALDQAKELKAEVVLIDRDIGVTLKRVYANVTWYKKMMIFSGLIASVISREEVSEEEIERLKEGDILETTFAQFAEQEKDLFAPLIDERDQYMAARLEEAVLEHDHKDILAVVGAGHLQGIKSYLQKNIENINSLTDTDAQTTDKDRLAKVKQLISHLEEIPKKTNGLKYFPWLIVILILFGFTLGFQKSSELGWQMVMDWVLINGGLSALGAFIATAHPITVLTAFVAAPLTSLNPMVGAGMVTAATEIWIRKPNVGDFSKLRKDTTSIKGWWKNKVARTFLVFFFSTLGSAIGTYVAGFKIFESLM
ncbi:MAG: TraB/GumN family protein [Pseudomonadota bacterium]